MGYLVVGLHMRLRMLALCGIAALVASLIFALLYARRRRRWQMLAAVVCGILGTSCVFRLVLLLHYSGTVWMG